MSTPTKKPVGRSEITTPINEVGIMPMDLGIRAKLSIMMFLQYFTWGAFFPTMSNYLGTLKFSNEQVGLAYGTSALGAIVAPFVVGMIADRFFATQRILAVLHLLGAGVLFAVSRVTDFGSYYPLLLVYFCCYMPTLALTNSLSFSHMTSPEKQFPMIRVLGTIGWIAAGITTSLLGFEYDSGALQMGALASGALAVFCLALPNTPPAKAGQRVTVRDILGLDALSMLKERSFAIFVIGSFLICIPLQFYYGFTGTFLGNIGVKYVAAHMAIGQGSEILFMIVMPLFFLRLGVKYMLLVGMACWAARYVLFAFGNSTDGMWMLYIGLALHGICYDFFFVTGYIYVDKKAPDAVRASAQGLITLITLGIGGFIGTWLAGLTGDYFTNEGVTNWQHFWLVPAAAAAVVTVIFAFSFRDRTETNQASRS